MAERTPYVRASYDAVLTTPRPPTPPTTTGLPRSDGLSRCSTEAKKAARSRGITDASGRMAATYRGAPTGSSPRCGPRTVHSRACGARCPQARSRRGSADGAGGKRPYMTTTLIAESPEDLLAAVPVVLGFHPEHSLAM